MLRSLLVLVLAVTAMVGCAGAAESTDSDSDSDIGVVSQAITSGKLDTGDTATVALLHAGQVYCTGVLVGPYAVATAGHCVGDVKPDQVFFGSDPKGDDGTMIDVADVTANPDFDPDTLENDIAIVGLKKPGPITPVTLVEADTIDDSWVGKTITIVGFGLTKATEDDTGPKRTGTSKIDAVDDGTFRFTASPSQTCSGDSGGPAFIKSNGKTRLIGITSSGDTECKTYGRDTRVDAQLDFIKSYTDTYSALALHPVNNAGCSAAGTGTNAPRGGVFGLVVAALALVIRRRRAS